MSYSGFLRGSRKGFLEGFLEGAVSRRCLERSVGEYGHLGVCPTQASGKLHVLELARFTCGAEGGSGLQSYKNQARGLWSCAVAFLWSVESLKKGSGGFGEIAGFLVLKPENLEPGMPRLPSWAVTLSPVQGCRKAWSGGVGKVCRLLSFET